VPVDLRSDEVDERVSALVDEGGDAPLEIASRVSGTRWSLRLSLPRWAALFV